MSQLVYGSSVIGCSVADLGPFDGRGRDERRSGDNDDGEVGASEWR